jgi:hypothetical protein
MVFRPAQNLNTRGAPERNDGVTTAPFDGDGRSGLDGANVNAGLGDDLIWGAVAIAEAINRSPRQTVHLLEKARIPARKIGGRWCASRPGLRQFFSDSSRGGAAK